MYKWIPWKHISVALRQKKKKPNNQDEFFFISVTFKYFCEQLIDIIADY